MRDVTIHGRIPTDEGRGGSFSSVRLMLSQCDDGGHYDAGVSMLLDDGSSELTFASAQTIPEALTELADRWEAIVKELRDLASKERG